jgi:hypothetical protein
MARFKLREGYEEKDLGRKVLEIAATNGKSGGKLSAEQQARFEQQLKDMVDQAFAASIKVVYDGPDTIHIVIPWVGGADYTGNDLADECMGSIVITGCAS